ncbi:EAL domain-containing protein [Psychrosphaera ytuae]|uniref:EAL domain-containing protein n=1 Tax=Psychrosphaera ytuae TaxID=2820710 RepID=A0A975D9S7_9GAMM|nr:EAL domain-containing protein [Psychrosphaera ytuae]QTH63167.1 EAL domain-containing protein [Psychrosphaera ytuae]
MASKYTSKSEPYLFAGQSLHDDSESEVLDHLPAWNILVVDDEPEVHKVTQMALENMVISGRRLQFLNAYSGYEAKEILAKKPNIAVTLLDVVMESDDAGLKLVRTIREELQLKDIRIILRTGQPGYAPEERVVIDYDINDYVTKTELTRNRLLTTLCTAIRSYQQIKHINESRDFLQKLNVMNSTLIEQKSFVSFVRRLVLMSIDLFSARGPGVFLLNSSEQRDSVDKFYVEFSNDELYSFSGQLCREIIPTYDVGLIEKALQKKSSIIDRDRLILYIPSKSCVGILIIYDADSECIRNELVESFVSNMASDLDNSLLLKKVSDIAFLDEMTQMPNRSRFIQHLDDFVKPDSQMDTVMLLDIEHFSDINDGLGQEAGNNLLVGVAERLNRQFGDDAIICRVGADIFGLIGSGEKLHEYSVLAIFDQPFKVSNNQIPVNARLGICRKPDSSESGLTVIKHANIALNKAKKDSQSRFNVYRPEMEDETSWRLSMIRKLTDDFFESKLQVWYQPQVDIETEKVIGVEALLRWPNDDGGFISPLTFIPLAEYTGLIVDIGAWVLEQSCIEVNRLKKLGHGRLRVAVNVSMPQFKNGHFVDDVISVAKAYGIPPEDIELEITESVVMDDTHHVISALEKLRANGFTVAIDDFGTGFSSLSYLHKLPLNRLKVDREFIREIGEGGDGAIAETIVELGQKLGLEVIAEGIETKVQLEYIKKLGCDEAQGYYFAKPMPGYELERFLSELNANSETKDKAS